MVVLLIVCDLCLCGYIVYDKLLTSSVNNNNDTMKTTIKSEVNTTENPSNSSSQDDNHVKKYELSMKDRKEFDFKNYIGYDLDHNLLINVMVSDVMLNNKSHIFYLKNFTSNYERCMEEENKYDSIYLNDALLYSQYYEGCYLMLLNRIVILNNQKFLGALYSTEGGYILKIYDDNGKEITSIFGIEIWFENDQIFTKYFDDDDSDRYINTYEYKYDGNSYKKAKIIQGVEKYEGIL